MLLVAQKQLVLQCTSRSCICITSTHSYHQAWIDFPILKSSPSARNIKKYTNMKKPTRVSTPPGKTKRQAALAPLGSSHHYIYFVQYWVYAAPSASSTIEVHIQRYLAKTKQGRSSQHGGRKFSKMERGEMKKSSKYSKGRVSPLSTTCLTETNQKEQQVLKGFSSRKSQLQQLKNISTELFYKWSQEQPSTICSLLFYAKRLPEQKAQLIF